MVSFFFVLSCRRVPLFQSRWWPTDAVRNICFKAHIQEVLRFSSMDVFQEQNVGLFYLRTYVSRNGLWT